MPNAMDIGYLIEVEVSLLENPNENCIIQYGPIEMDKDIKNAIEILLTNGSTKFNLNVFDKNKQEKIENKELILYLNNNELKLVDIDFNHNETLLEKVKYNFFNPNIKLNSTNQNRFNLTFFEFESNFKYENIEINNNINIKEKIKSEYELIAMSKQNRELIYLIIQFFIIDEKIKNNKIFSMVNYSSFDYETKIGITELIGELKIIKEENNIYMKNMKILKNENLRLNKDLKDLEDDFHITMKNINDNNINNNFNSNFNNNNNNNFNNNLNKNVSLLTENDNYKIKFNDLNDLYNSLIAKEKALNEEKNELNKKNENLNKINNNNNKLISDLKEKNSNLENDIEIINKNYNTINEENKKLKNDLKLNENKIKILEENLNNLKNDLKKFNNNENNINKETLEKLTFENKNLIQQRNMLSNQKSDYIKQIEKLKNENTKLISESKNLKEKFDNLNNKFNKLNEEFNLLNENKLILENDNKTLKEINNNLNNIINNNNKININNSYSSINIKITPEEYEEYDNLRKEKDENDAIILQLKSNNNAKDLEIENLKKIIESYKK